MLQSIEMDDYFYDQFYQQDCLKWISNLTGLKKITFSGAESLSMEEAAKLLKALTPLCKKATLQKPFRIYIKAHKPDLDMDEVNRMRGLLMGLLQDAFKEMDPDGSGTITKEELTTSIANENGGKMNKNMVNAKVKAFLAEKDTDGDGKISHSEYTSFYEDVLDERQLEEGDMQVNPEISGDKLDNFDRDVVTPYLAKFV